MTRIPVPTLPDKISISSIDVCALIVLMKRTVVYIKGAEMGRIPSNATELVKDLELNISTLEDYRDQALEASLPDPDRDRL